jgi:hypothetical protein
MKRFFTIKALLAAALVLFQTGIARAHTVWFEPLDGQLVIRFAEPDGSYEKSPGHLDSLGAPAAFTVITNVPVGVVAPKSTNHFAMTGASLTNVAGVESLFTVRAARKPHFYARWQPANAGAGSPTLTFDLVPTGKTGEVRVYFRGQPLGGLKATLRTPDEKEREIAVDADGYIRFESRQSGLHLLTIPHYRENVAGFHLGRAYQQTSHNTALSWVQP